MSSEYTVNEMLQFANIFTYNYYVPVLLIYATKSRGICFSMEKPIH